MVQNSDVESPKVKPRYPLTSVGNALQLLFMFRDREELRVSDVSTHLNVANSTAHRLLAMLQYHDLVQQIGSRVYVAGPALLEAGLAVMNSVDVRVHARSFLVDLHTRFDETVHLADLVGRDVRFLDAIEGTQTLRVVERVNALMPAHSTSVGKALLAELDESELDKLFVNDDAFVSMTSATIRSREALNADLEVVRDRGYATSDGESEVGVASVAIAIRTPDGGVIGALNVAAPSTRMSAQRRREIGKALIEAAEGFEASYPT